MTAIRVRIPTPLRKLTEGRGLVEVGGKTVAEVVDDLERRYPGLKERVCDESGAVRRFINIYVNEEDIRFMQGSATPVNEGDEVSIVPAIAGGASLRIRLVFPEDKIKDPVIYQIGQEHKVVTNIRRADVTEKTGWVDLELSGDTKEIDRAVEGLKKKGVTVTPIERNVIE